MVGQGREFGSRPARPSGTSANLQSLVEIGVDKNTTVVFPAPLMSTIQELGAFLTREQAASTPVPAAPTNGAPSSR